MEEALLRKAILEKIALGSIGVFWYIGTTEGAAGDGSG
jgi:hypothetical protein